MTRKRTLMLTAVALGLALLVGFGLAARQTAAQPPPPGSGFAGGQISLSDFGWSNATAIPIVGDVLSGDFALNVQYRTISDRGWLNPSLDTPGEACRGSNQLTGSLWTVVTPLTPVSPPPGALSAATSAIEKVDGDVHLRMDLQAVVWDTQTQMGYRPVGRGSVLSRSGVLEMTYTLTNLGDRPVLDLKMYQYLHAHPNGSCYDIGGEPSHLVSEIEAAYDPKLYKVDDPNFPSSQKYHFDLSSWAPDIIDPVDPSIVYPGSTVGIGALEPPSIWGMGPVGLTAPTTCAAEPDLIWCQIESGRLPEPRATRMGPDNIGGVLGWELPRLNADHSVSRHVLLAVSDDRPPSP